MDKLFDSLLLIIKMTLLTVIIALVYLSFPNSFSEFHAFSWSLKEKPEESALVNENEQFHEYLLTEAAGVETVRKQCLSCHSAQLIVQNRMSRVRWKETIEWMQETQGLWALGDDEVIILDYLATHYAPEHIGRRANIDPEAITWYILEKE
jgi:hypothetical protein